MIPVTKPNLLGFSMSDVTPNLKANPKCHSFYGQLDEIPEAMIING